MADGWICLHRKICDHWLWDKKPFSEGQAFVDILLMANYKEKKFRLGNEVVSADSGTIVTSQVKLSERWGWGRKKVSSFLKALESDGMIITISDNKRTKIIVVNYNAYQEFGNSNDISSNSNITGISDGIGKKQEHQRNSKGTSTEHHRNTNNKENNRNKETITPPTPSKGADGAEAVCQNQGESLKVKTAGGIENHSTTLDEDFNRFWQLYPKKADKQKALKAWKKLKPDRELQSVMLAVLGCQKQSVQWLKDNGQFIPYPATWLNGRRWEDMQEQVLRPAPPKCEYDPDNPYANWD